MSDFLINGAVANALNMPSITAEEAPKLRPYMKLAEQLGSLAGQITDGAISKIEVEFIGAASDVNPKPLVSAALSNLLGASLDSVNMVNAPQVANARGIAVSEVKTQDGKDLHAAIRIKVTADGKTRSVTGTLFAGKEPRLVEIEGVLVEGALSAHMLYTRNHDKPGFIGALGTLLGNAKQNIADFRLGRTGAGDTAVALVCLDGPVSDALLSEIGKLPHIMEMKRLKF
jgi:D-3-phosphoglycerate dehydrogenase